MFPLMSTAYLIAAAADNRVTVCVSKFILHRHCFIVL